MTNSQRMKTRFRRTARWLRFRKNLKKEQRTDPVTGAALAVNCNCHHMDLDESHYTDISDKSHFVMLNKTTHEMLHFVYNAKSGWRNAIAQLAKLCERMEEINEHV